MHQLTALVDAIEAHHVPPFVQHDRSLSVRKPKPGGFGSSALTAIHPLSDHAAPRGVNGAATPAATSPSLSNDTDDVSGSTQVTSTGTHRSP